MKRAVLSVCILALALILTACGPTPSDSAVSTGDSASGDHAFDYGGDVTLRILSGSENQELEGILDDFARERGVNIEMEYQGSLDIMRTLQGETVDYDAVWPASSLWLTAGDTQYRVKHAQSISITPVVFGIRQGLAEELGFVGDVVEVNAAPVQAMLDAGYIPVVAPVGTDGKGNSFNINGDTAAGKLASALGAEKLMLLTDIEGLCNDIKLRDVISYLNIADVQGLKDQGTIAGGMIPKVDCCVQAIEEGVTNVHIIDGRKPHSILYEAFTDEGIGTTVGKDVPSVGIKWK